MKNRIMSFLAAVLLTAAVSLPSFAADYYASDESGNATIPDYIASITISEENVAIPRTGEKNTYELSPDGNLTLVDDFYEPAADGDAEAKQFLTVTTKSGNTFYIIVDRDGNTDNVHFLNMVDEADLLALFNDETPETTTSETTTEPSTAAQEPETPAKEKNSNTGLILILLLVLGGGGFAFYWFRLRGKNGTPAQAVPEEEPDDEPYETEDEDGDDDA